VSTRPAGLPHPWGATSCREAAPLTYLRCVLTRRRENSALSGLCSAQRTENTKQVFVLTWAIGTESPYHFWARESRNTELTLLCGGGPVHAAGLHPDPNPNPNPDPAGNGLVRSR